MVLIPWQSLSAQALTGVLDAYILREGTDYTQALEGPTLAAKREAVLGQLRSGVASIVYHAELESIDIRLTEELPANLRP